MKAARGKEKKLHYMVRYAPSASHQVQSAALTEYVVLELYSTYMH